LLEPLAASAGLDLEGISVTPAGRRRMLRVVVDSDAGVQLDTVAELSRKISEVLDGSDAMGAAPYVLEVTSPGTDRPLAEPHHFARNRGRLVKMRLAADEELIARVVEVDDEGVEVEVPGVKGRKPTARRITFAEIAGARVEVEFNRKNADGVADAEQGQEADAAEAVAEEAAEEAADDETAAADSDESIEEA
jgi:ribosome maturation factor RimP